jgi:hypothetical protein
LSNAIWRNASRLYALPVDRSYFEPIIRIALLLTPPKNLVQDSEEAREWSDLNTYVGLLSDRYAAEIGENAYGVFNAITDFASRPPENRLVRREVNSLQRLAGIWFTGFGEQCRQADFTLDGYLARAFAN